MDLPAAAPEPTWRGRLRALDSWLAAFPVSLWAISRSAILLNGQIGTAISTTLQADKPHREFLAKYPALDALCRWDCGFFQELAQDGYTHVGYVNFFPLYPMLARGLHLASFGLIHVDIALILVANLAALGAYVVLYHLFRELEGEGPARAALLLLVFFPFSFFHAAAYPESLMMLLSAAAMYLALRGRHLGAGVALGLGVLSRHLTLLAGGGLLIAQLQQRPSARRFLLSPAVLGLALPFAFLGGYSAFQWVRFGDPLAFVHMRNNWGPDAWSSVLDFLALRELMHQLYVGFAVPVAIGAVALCTRRRWLPLAGFAVPLMLVASGIGLSGLGRYTASCWPAFLPLGVWLSRRPEWVAPVAAALALTQGTCFFLFAHHFTVL